MVKEKSAKIILLVIICIPIVGLLSFKLLVNPQENPQEWINNNTRVAFTGIYGDSPYKNHVVSVLETKEGGYILAGNIADYPSSC